VSGAGEHAAYVKSFVEKQKATCAHQNGQTEKSKKISIFQVIKCLGNRNYYRRHDRQQRECSLRGKTGKGRYDARGKMDSQERGT
jgi:hypothetical protein